MNEQKMSNEKMWMLLGLGVMAAGVLQLLVIIVTGISEPVLVSVLFAAFATITGACIFLIGLFGRIFLDGCVDDADIHNRRHY